VSFAPLWQHIAECEFCSQTVTLDLCREGQRIQQAVFQAAAKRIAPIPTERKEPAS